MCWGISTLQQVFCSEILCCSNERPSAPVQNVQFSAFDRPRDVEVGCLYLVVIRIHQEAALRYSARHVASVPSWDTEKSPLHRDTTFNGVARGNKGELTKVAFGGPPCG
jgi:hypothetical protein